MTGPSLTGQSSPDPVLVGPHGRIAADSAFAVALVTLWHRVSLAGGAVGFTESATRREIADQVTEVVDAVKRGRADGLALHEGRTLVGYVTLTPGRRLAAHGGVIGSLMVDPERQGHGLGSGLLGSAEQRARDLGLERADLTVRDGRQEFFTRRGYRIWGVDHGRIRVAPGDDRDELHLVKELR